MVERHGVSTEEVPFKPLTQPYTDATIPVVFGTAPINLSKAEKPPVNVPILAKSWDEAVEALGYSDDWETFTLCEFMYSHFQLYKQSPVVLVNVMDPKKHKTAVPAAERSFVGGLLTLPENGLIKTSIVIKSEDEATTYEVDKDYTLAFNSSGKLVVSVKAGGALTPASKVKVIGERLDRTKVTNADLIGGTDATTGEVTGLELIKQVFPRFQLVTGLILSPGYSHDPLVGNVMAAKANMINGHFFATAITDIPANMPYTEVPKWKQDNAYTADLQINAWPKATYKGRKYHLSTHIAGVICKTDAENEFVPYRSPSNKTLMIDGAVLDDGAEVSLGVDEAAYLNAQGIMTAINFVGGWKSWGNRTASYPEKTDPQDTFISVRRMFNWLRNSLVLRYWRDVDDPGNKRLIEKVTDDGNIWMNGLQGAQYILGGRLEFNAAENPPADLVDGKFKFHVYASPPSPGQSLHFIVEYDAQYLSAITG
ncbi:tail protein [Paenibacillus albilobatus]|uniref:Tail protein n=1 Tax=Paenibacillus albilobatus TaxID=2716884 RepID=A0A919XI71_9BACL|nr:phage tail sheath family protein [Paenibacillus albilobatus]GIO33124.1 tail protein [Paenibacillus albilobatus]